MNTKNKYPQAQNPLILRCHRLMEAFAKSDDERDFYLDRVEGFLLYADLDKPEEELNRLEKELESNPDRYVAIPKMTFYETKKIMEGFVNEKVYDIDTKEKLLEIIQSKEARENFLDFIYDHHSELEKWQQYYQERSRIRIIEWLRQNHFEFVFEEDLDVPKEVMEKLKTQLFETKVGKDVVGVRKLLVAKAKTYYSTEALNPRPKRGRPPKQVAKTEVEPQMTSDMYTTVPSQVRPFLFLPDYTQGTTIIFSQKFENEEQLMARKKLPTGGEYGINLETLNQKLSAIRNLSSKWEAEERAIKEKTSLPKASLFSNGEMALDETEEEEFDLDSEGIPQAHNNHNSSLSSEKIDLKKLNKRDLNQKKENNMAKAAKKASSAKKTSSSSSKKSAAKKKK